MISLLCQSLLVLSLVSIVIAKGQASECFYCVTDYYKPCLPANGETCANPLTYPTFWQCAEQCRTRYKCNPDFTNGKDCEPCMAHMCTGESYVTREECFRESKCGAKSGFQCLATSSNTHDFKCRMCKQDCQPGLPVFDSLEECDRISFCNALIVSNPNETERVAKWQCGSSGICSLCGGPDKRVPRCDNGRGTFDFVDDCFTYSKCIRPIPRSRFQCLSDTGSCNVCREDLDECVNWLASYDRPKDCMAQTQCHKRDSAYFGWYCDAAISNHQTTAVETECKPCSSDECNRHSNVVYSLEECVLQSSCVEPKVSPSKQVYQCAKDVCLSCSLDRKECNPDLDIYTTASQCIFKSGCSTGQVTDKAERDRLGFSRCAGTTDSYLRMCENLARAVPKFCDKTALRQTCLRTCCLRERVKKES